MVNYTSTGYGKLKAPARTMEILLDFWNKNHRDEKVENWNRKYNFCTALVEWIPRYRRRNTILMQLH
jgi:hypothetical protein